MEHCCIDCIAINLSSGNLTEKWLRPPISSGLCPRTAALLSLPGARHGVLPKAEAGDAERDVAAGGPSARDDGC